MLSSLPKSPVLFCAAMYSTSDVIMSNSPAAAAPSDSKKRKAVQIEEDTREKKTPSKLPKTLKARDVSGVTKKLKGLKVSKELFKVGGPFDYLEFWRGKGGLPLEGCETHRRGSGQPHPSPSGQQVVSEATDRVEDFAQSFTLRIGCPENEEKESLT
jgi:hypothetical protein